MIPTINQLLALPFALKIATKDWHPTGHISFAANHPGKQPFVDFVTVVNPSNADESYSSRLWPVHCVQDTAGAALVPELNTAAVDIIVEKGQDARVEMYSAFYDPLQRPRVSDSGLAARLKAKMVTDVYLVGLAGDYCVRSTAEDAKSEGFAVWIVEDGTRPVDPALWEQTKAEIRAAGVHVISSDSPEVRRLTAE